MNQHYHALLFLVSLFVSIHPSRSFVSFLTKKAAAPPRPKSPGIQRIELENELIKTIERTKRLDNSMEVANLISRLEQSGWSIPQPAIAPQVIGKWRLLYTNNAETASPIQRKAVDASAFNIYQDITLRDVQGEGGYTVQRLIVSQIVKFGLGTQLCVDALASTSKYPLEELTERIGTGEILGVNVLGVSKVGEEAKEDPNKPDSRIDFVFDEGNFDVFNSFKVPYPVPFRLPILRDTVKGWIDITYLSDNLRISKGNKGTTFV
eukprot:CAMPEP_0203667202 /NCGR_PEP_ID=MMETSP0090-20130426/4086_1 /ASSEMBLY_ACC=CAM_ASM_001088 /TAXON_ID=426623 /ORGANISM="Chaetoceros affinis, Strain CCMP159" /LENGTH=263 /DNA_ID=CAMNT_0050531303 /DNA_START=32 /DNA_END=820 /DNA_ORIENTATION=+